MKKAPIIFCMAFLCLFIYVETKAAYALIVGTNKCVISQYSATTPVTIRMMQNGVDLGVVAAPFTIEASTGSYSVVGGLLSGKKYKFQVVINGQASAWTNEVTSF